MELLERTSFLQTLGQYADEAGQGDGSDVPHWAQKRLVTAFSAMQFGQRMG